MSAHLQYQWLTTHKYDLNLTFRDDLRDFVVARATPERIERRSSYRSRTPSGRQAGLPPSQPVSSVGTTGVSGPMARRCGSVRPIAPPARGSASRVIAPWGLRTPVDAPRTMGT
jgi:hypothetical protein